MVEVVVAFTDGDESSDEMVTRSVLIIEGGFSEIVSKRIDAEGWLGQGKYIEQKQRQDKVEYWRDEQTLTWQHLRRRTRRASLPNQDRRPMLE